MSRRARGRRRGRREGPTGDGVPVPDAPADADPQESAGSEAGAESQPEPPPTPPQKTMAEIVAEAFGDAALRLMAEWGLEAADLTPVVERAAGYLVAHRRRPKELGVFLERALVARLLHRVAEESDSRVEAEGGRAPRLLSYALHQLKPEVRFVTAPFLVSDRPLAEIAARAGVTEEVAQTYVQRGVGLIRQIFVDDAAAKAAQEAARVEPGRGGSKGGVVLQFRRRV